MSNYKVQNVNLFSKILLTLYLLVGLSHFLGALSTVGFQWLYFSVLNVVSLVFIYGYKEVLLPFAIGRHASRFFLLFFLFLLFTIISVSQAIIVSESIVNIFRLINIFTAIYIITVLVKNEPKIFFEYVCKICLILLFYYSYITISHYLGNYNKPRNVLLYRSFKHDFGNINFFTAFLVLKLPFVIYLFLKSDSKFWKYISAVTIFTTTLSLYFAGSRTAILSIIIIFLTSSIYYIKRGLNNKPLLFKGVYLLLVPFISLFLMVNVNRIDKSKMNSFKTFYNYVPTNIKQVDKFYKLNKEIANSPVKIVKEEDSFTIKLLKKTGRFEIWKTASNIFLSNPMLGIGYGNFKMYPKDDYYKNLSNSNGNFSRPNKVHNDFFEKFLETGIIGGILYLMLFIFLISVFINQLKTKNKDIIFILLLSFSAYILDAFFNFPIERIPVQLLFIIVVAFLLAFTINNNSKEAKDSSVLKGIYIPVILISLLSLVSNYYVNKNYSIRSIQKNYKVFKKMGLYRYDYKEMKQLIKPYPALGVSGINMNHYLGSYALNNGDFDEAIDIFNEAIDNKGNNLTIRKQIGEAFLRYKKDKDSAAYYFNSVFKIHPSYKSNYSYLKKIYLSKKDMNNYERVLNTYTKNTHLDVSEWIAKAEYYSKKEKDKKVGISIIDTALFYNKKSIALIKAKKKFLLK